jgi:hypothetical protein
MHAHNNKRSTALSDFFSSARALCEPRTTGRESGRPPTLSKQELRSAVAEIIG